MKVKFQNKVITIDDDFPESVSELLKKLDLSSEEVIVIRDKKVLIEREKLDKKDEIEIIKVISGG